MDAYDIPLFQRLGSKPPAISAVKHEWQEEGLLPSSTTANEAMDGTETGLDVATGTGAYFKAGYLIQQDSEKMRVTSVSTDTLTVVRGYAGTTAATHANGATVTIVGQAVADGADPATFSTTDRSPLYNFHQTFQELIEVSTQDEWARIYGINDKFGHEVDKWLKILAIRSENSIIKGTRYEDSTNKTRLMGGLDFFITTNATDAASADVDEDVINGQLRKVYNNGGRSDLIAVGPTQKSKVSALISASQRWFPRPGTEETIGVAADMYVSDFGRQELMMDRNIDADRAYYLSTDLIKKVTGMPFTLENLAKTGAARRAQILGWFSLEVKAEKRHAISYGLSTT